MRSQAERLEAMPYRKRQGLVPDFAIMWDTFRDLWDAKTLHQSINTYPPGLMDEKCGAVNRRAAKVDADCNRQARKTDRNYNGVDTSDMNIKGPVQLRLQEFGKVKGLVFGPRGETSDEVEELVNKMAKKAAERQWRNMGARSAVEARGVVKARITRSLGIAAVRAAARLKLDRLGIALGDGPAAAGRRNKAHAKHRSWGFEYSQRFGPQGHSSARPSRF